MSQFHFDPATYMEMMLAEIPLYETLQDTVASAAEGITITTILDLGTGTGETLGRILGRHVWARAFGVDESEEMLAAARQGLAGYSVDLRVADLLDPLPAGPFDLVTSALAVHHLDGPGKAELFGRITEVLRPGGRFVLGDVVIPEDPSDAVTPLSADYDRPSRVDKQVEWLTAAGLVVTVVWAQGDLAVISADRPLPHH
jgi:tRNA (cmo5U34)-methyltransferase